MSDDFDKMFGHRPITAPTFTERLGRGAADVPPAAPRPSDPSAYRPYDCLKAGAVVEACDVQRWLDETEVPEGLEFQYRFLLQVGYVGEELLKLFLPDCIVVIEGKGLRELRKNLTRRQVSFIQQYNPRVWALPPKGEPIIDSIKVVRPQAVNG